MHEVMQQAVQQTAGQMARFQEKQEQPAGHTELHQQAEANTHHQQQQLQEALAEQQAKRPSGSMTPPPFTPRMPFPEGSPGAGLLMGEERCPGPNTAYSRTLFFEGCFLNFIHEEFSSLNMVLLCSVHG